MPVDLFGKLCSVLVGIKDMKTAPVKGQPEWRCFDVAPEEVQDGERACSFGRCGLFFRFLYRNVGCIHPDDIESVLRQPDCVVASAAADLQCPTGSDGKGGHCLNEVKVRFADVPRCEAFFICLPEMIFDAHNNVSCPWFSLIKLDGYRRRGSAFFPTSATMIAPGNLEDGNRIGVQSPVDSRHAA
jgi:hypothetical protein